MITLAVTTSVQAELKGKIAFTKSDGLYVMDAVGGPDSPIVSATDIGTPSWSLNGEWITFAMGGGLGGPSDIYVIRPDGSGLRNVTPKGSGYYVEPSFSPDGSQITFCGPDGSALYIINTDADGQTPPTRLPVDGSFPHWSPLGDKILYSNWGRTYESDLLLYDLDTSTLNNITNDHQGYVLAEWSPDAKKLAGFCSWPDGRLDDIFVMDADGSNLDIISAPWSSSNECYPTWSSDGQYIVFTSDRSGNGNWDIRYTRVDNWDPMNIPDSPENEYLLPAIGVPEPATLLLLGLGGLVLRSRRK